MSDKTKPVTFCMRLTREESQLLRQRASRMKATRSELIRAGIREAIEAERALVKRQRAASPIGA